MNNTIYALAALTVVAGAANGGNFGAGISDVGAAAAFAAVEK